MPLHIIRDTITHMHTDAIVNTANRFPVVGIGCDEAISGTLTARESLLLLLNSRKKLLAPLQELQKISKKRKNH